MDLGVDDPMFSGETIWRAIMWIGMVGLGVTILRMRRTGREGRWWRALLERLHAQRTTLSDRAWRDAYEAGWRYLELTGWLAIATAFLVLAPVYIQVVTASVFFAAAVVAVVFVIGLARSAQAARAARYLRS